jgi:hypothetical protein
MKYVSEESRTVELLSNKVPEKGMLHDIRKEKGSVDCREGEWSYKQGEPGNKVTNIHLPNRG